MPYDNELISFWKRPNTASEMTEFHYNEWLRVTIAPSGTDCGSDTSSLCMHAHDGFNSRDCNGARLLTLNN